MARLWWFLVVATLPLAAGAQAYRWVDEKGQVHYSQVPPTGRESRSVGPPPPPSAAPNQESLNRSLAAENEAAPKHQEETAGAAQAKAQREEQCRQAREQLAFMDAKTARRLGTTDAQGNVSRVTEEEFQGRRAELQKAADERCG